MRRIGKWCGLLLAICLCLSSAVACGKDKEEQTTPEYTVTYDVNGGVLTGPASVKAKKGTTVTLPAAENSGYLLDGWYAGETLAGKAGEAYTVHGDVTLKAHWNKEQAPDLSAQYAAENRARALEYAKLIREKYWNADTQLSKLTPSGGKPFLWPYTEQVSMANAVFELLTPQDQDYEMFKAYLEQTLEGLRYYRVSDVRVEEGQSWNNDAHVLAAYGENDGTANSYAIYNSGRNDSAKDSVNAGMDGIFFDDNIWVAKEFYYAYRNLGDQKYLNEAVNIVNWIIGEGYETTKGLNGIYWKWAAKFLHAGVTNDNLNASLNACSSAPTGMMLVKLYNAMGEGDNAAKFAAVRNNYLSTARSLYNFLWNTLRDENDNILRDKIFVNKKGEDLGPGTVDQQKLPYNTGTYMTLGAELYNNAVQTGNTAAAELYRTRNAQVADGSDRVFANTEAVKGQYSYNSNSWFTSFLLEGYIDLLPQDENCKVYIEHMRSSLDYGWKNNRADDGLVAPAWVVGWTAHPDMGPNSEGNGRQILLQSANAHCYAMLARHYAA